MHKQDEEGYGSAIAFPSAFIRVHPRFNCRFQVKTLNSFKLWSFCCSVHLILLNIFLFEAQFLRRMKHQHL